MMRVDKNGKIITYSQNIKRMVTKEKSDRPFKEGRIARSPKEIPDETKKTIIKYHKQGNKIKDIQENLDLSQYIIKRVIDQALLEEKEFNQKTEVSSAEIRIR